MKTNKVRDIAAKKALRRSVKFLSPAARESVIEGFCIPHCGRKPDEEFCPMARRNYRILLSLLLETHMGNN